MQTWLKMTVADLGRGIGAGDIDPVEGDSAASPESRPDS